MLTVTAETTFDADGDLLSLQEMADAIAAEMVVEAEGEARLNEETGALEVREVEVETDCDDDADDGEKFDGTVASVDVTGGTFTLEGGVVFTVTAATIFDADGDLISLQPDGRRHRRRNGGSRQRTRGRGRRIGRAGGPHGQGRDQELIRRRWGGGRRTAVRSSS